MMVLLNKYQYHLNPTTDWLELTLCAYYGKKGEIPAH